MGKEGGLNTLKLTSSLKRFWGNDEQRTREAIEEYVKKNPGVTKAQVYQALADGKGPGKSHMSAYKEGEFRSPVRRNGRGGSRTFRY